MAISVDVHYTSAGFGIIGVEGALTGSLMFDGYLETSATVTVKPYGYSGSTYELTQTINRSGGSGATVYSSFSFTIPRSWLFHYNGSNDTRITVSAVSNRGSTSSNGNGRVVIPSDVVPKIGSIGAAFSDDANLGVYLQHKSTLTTVTASGLELSEGTTFFRRRRVIIQGESSLGWVQIFYRDEEYTGSGPATSIDANTLMGYAQIRVIFYIMDQRGVEVSATAYFDFVLYSPPRIENYRAFRCDSDGTENNLGGYVSLIVNWVYDDLGGYNSASASFIWGSQGGQMSTPINLPSGTLIGPLGDGTVNPEQTYVFRVTIADKLESVTTQDLLINSMVLAMTLLAGGKGAAFGKIATEQNMLDCAWAIKCTKAVLPSGCYIADFTPNNSIVSGGHTGPAIYDKNGTVVAWFAPSTLNYSVYTRGSVIQNQPGVLA